jgi:hypothetical protein
MDRFDITESGARKITNQICLDFDIPKCYVWFIDIKPEFTEKHDALAWYSQRSQSIPAYMMINRNWKERLLLTLHEITHHVQVEIYEEEVDPHGYGFQLAKSRVSTWAKNNISDNYEWKYFLQYRQAVIK